MSIVNDKLEELKHCLGEKKLKQLGLIPCATCQQIVIQAASLNVPSDINDKTFLTSEEMSSINQTVAQSVTQSASHTALDVSADHTLTVTPSNEETASTGENTPQTITISQQDLDDESAFLKKLATILKYSQPANTEDLGMGYIYTCPTVPLPHALSCTECGRLYTIAHPTLELLPLPIFLTDTEYELIKGIYVDITL